MEFIDINLKAIEKLECKSLAFVSLLFIKLRRRHKKKKKEKEEEDTSALSVIK